MDRASLGDKLISLQGDFWKTHQPGHASLAIKKKGFSAKLDRVKQWRIILCIQWSVAHSEIQREKDYHSH